MVATHKPPSATMDFGLSDLAEALPFMPMMMSPFSGGPKADDPELHGFLPSSTLSSAGGSCANCNAANVISRCSGCQIVKQPDEGPKIIFAVYYCNQKCMSAHWTKHKIACKEVRTLRRAASMFTELYDLFLRENWSSAASDVSIDQRGLMTLHMDNGYAESDRRTYLGLPLIRPFPFSGDHASAILHNEGCRQFFRLGKPLFDAVMRGKLPNVLSTQY